MEIIFLGTSSGTPTKHRNVSATVIKHKHLKTWCLVDCGEGTQHQLLHTSLATQHLSAIFITHVHGDHCFGLPGLLASAAMSGRQAPLTVVAPLAIKKLIEINQQLSDTYLSFEINFIDVNEFNQNLILGGFKINTHRLSHRVPCFAYGFTETAVERCLDIEKLQQAGIPAGPLWGQIQQGKAITLSNGTRYPSDAFLLPARPARSVIISGDNDSPELLSDAMAHADVLVHEATYTQEVADKVGPGPQHSSAQKVAACAAQASLKNLVLCHFSGRYQYGSGSDFSISEVAQEAAQYYQGSLFLANDFDRFELDKHGQLRLAQAGPLPKKNDE